MMLLASAALQETLQRCLQVRRSCQGVRESPEGGPHLSDSTQTDYAESSINTKADFCKGSARTCLSFETVHCSVQTELNMLTMNKILEAYDLMPTAVEPIIPERLRRHNSIDLAVDETNKDEPQKPSPILEEEREENKERDVITCQVDTTPVCAEPNDKVLIASEMESGSTTKEEDELDHVGDRKCSSETVISSRYMDIPPVILTCDEAENEDSSCTDDNKELLDNAQICLHPKNLKIASIIEFDRSDISSDSEPEQSFRRRTNRRTRTSLSKRSKVNLEAEPPEPEQTAALDENNNNNILSKLKQRRIGVSAEPVRVSWSILRENFKQQQIENIEDTHAMEYNNGYTEELIQDIEAEIESIPTGCSPEVINTGKVVTSSVPIIEVEEEQNEKVSSHSDSNHDDAAQKQSEPSEKIIEKTIDPAETTIESRDEEPDSKDEKEDETTEKDLSVNSLKVPEIVYKKKGSLLRQSRAFIPESCADMGDEDMERRFSNIVLSFQTDQYTLQKRRDNQERARDVAEASMDKEIAKFSSKIKELHTLQNGTQEFEEACGFLKRQAEILRKAAMKISAQSEQHGCYQQENRTVPNMELMIAYTGILKLNLSRMTDELSECRRRLQYQSDRSDLSECETIKVTSDGDAAIVDSNDDGNADDGQASSDPEPVRKATLAGISRTLILAQGISTKVRRKRKDALNVPTFTKKRVSFSETMFTEDSIAREPIIECSSNPAGLALHQMKRIGIKLAIFLFILLVIYFIFFTINSLEIDTLRLHDKILQYIPHSIEYQTNSEGR